MERASSMRSPPSTSRDEAGLIAAARLGDEEAFAELYRRHVGCVRAVGRTFLGKNDLDDMCQETFLRAFTRLHSFKGKSNFRTWITHIAKNRCLVTLRRNRQASNGESRLTSIDVELAQGEDKELRSVPARLDVARMLAVLKPFPRRVLEMAYLEELPHEEIAEMLGTTAVSVKSTIFHAKQRVRNK
jgi:RNA polymerase sigma-70 factor, ECF subfamily